MCKHVLNAQVAIRAQCCRKWYDCSECHAEGSDHPLRKTDEMVFACKKCKKVFRKDMTDYEAEDEFCPHCDNQYVIDALTPEARVGIETGDLRIDSRVVKDQRMKVAKDLTSIYDLEVSDTLG
ncbi:CHY zinc finger-domain-containing protein [Spinellus fusiger]|nr:CHY zinc finger-domain-containing protein [Spinellus fusiger]